MPTLNSQGLSATGMGTLAEEQMKQRVLEESRQSPGTLITGGQTGALQTGTEQTPVTFQAMTTAEQAPTEEKKKVGTLTSAPAREYVAGLEQRTLTADEELQKRANAALALNTTASQSQKDQDALAYYNQFSGQTGSFAIPGLESRVKQVRAQFEPEKQRLAEAQSEESATAKAAAFRMGQAGTDYAKSAFDKLTRDQQYRTNKLQEQEALALRSAWSSILSDNIDAAQTYEKEADAIVKQRKQAELDGMKQQKEALEVEKMAEARVDDTVQRMVKTGFEPTDSQLEYLDGKYGLDKGTSRTFFEVGRIDVARAEAKTRQEEQNAAVEGATKLQNLLEKVPIGTSIKIGGVEYTGLSRGDVKTGTETDEDGNVSFWEYDQASGASRITSLGNIGKAVDGWETRDLGDQGVWRVNAKTGESRPYYATQAQQEWQGVFPEGSTSPFKDANGNPRTQCGAFVNDLTGAGVGDTFESKMSKTDKSIAVDSDNPPQAGDFFVQKLGTWTGHVGIISGDPVRGPDGKWKVLALESNYPQKDKVTNSRWVNVDEISGFGRTGKLHPYLQTGPDSSKTVGGGVVGGAPSILGAGRKTEEMLSPTELQSYNSQFPSANILATDTVAQARAKAAAAAQETQKPITLTKVPTLGEFVSERNSRGELIDPTTVENEFEQEKQYRQSLSDGLNAVKRGKFANKAEKAEFVSQAEEYLANGDVDNFEALLEQTAQKNMSVDQQNKYTSARNIVQSNQAALDLINSFQDEKGFKSGTIKALVEDAKKRGAFDADPRYTQVEQLISTFQNEYRNALFGASLTPGEMTEANKVIVDIGSATPNTVRNKLTQGAKIQSFVADVRLADALGTKRPQLKDYLK